MRLHGLAAAGVAVCLGMVGPAHADPNEEPVGRWLTQDREGVIEIRPCATTGVGARELCGRVVGMDDPLDAQGRQVVDTRGRPQCGLAILEAAVETQPGLWQGKILNPNEGTMWQCEIWMAGGTVHLRGYVVVPLLGRTQIWTRYTGKLGPDCRIG